MIKSLASGTGSIQFMNAGSAQPSTIRGSSNEIKLTVPSQSSLIQMNNLGVQIGVDKGASAQNITLDAAANNAKLTAQPTDNSDTSLAIATVGYVKKNAITVDEGDIPKTGTLNLVTNVLWNGTQIVIEKTEYEFKNGVLIGAALSPTRTTIDTVAYSPS